MNDILVVAISTRTLLITRRICLTKGILKPSSQLTELLRRAISFESIYLKPISLIPESVHIMGLVSSSRGTLLTFYM